MKETEEIRSVTAESLGELLRLGHRRRRRGRGEPWADPKMGQGRVLALLKLQPEISQRELSYLLGGSRQGTAELLRKLEDRGFITREQSKEDRRTTTVRLTEKGRREQQKASGPKESLLRLLDPLSDEEVADLNNYLTVLVDGLQAEIDREDDESERGFGRRGQQHGHPGEGHGHGRGHRSRGGAGSERGPGDPEARFEGRRHGRRWHQ